jgi:hypothetical protein
MINLQEIGYFSRTLEKIQHFSIEDKLIQQFSTNVRLLSKSLQDWVELSTDWDFTIGKLRKVDWMLRNDPVPLSDDHQTLIDLSEGLNVLQGIYKNMSSEIQEICAHIVASSQKIIEDKSSNLTHVLLRILRMNQSGADKNGIVVRQESIKLPLSRWLDKNSFANWEVITAQQAIHAEERFSNLIVVGLTQDYPISLFNAIYPVNPIIVLSHSWIKEQKRIPGYFSDIAQVTLDLGIDSVNQLDSGSSAQEIALDYLEPSLEIDGRRLAVAAKRALSKIEKSADDELIECKAYLLGSGEVVFLPTSVGSIDALDPNAPHGEKVQRVPIASLTTDSILLLRVGTSEAEAIVNMANELGGAEARRCRVLQIAWKSRLKERMKILGVPRVARDLKELGILNPWLSEWAHIGTIRPNSLTNFTKLLEYLDIEPLETVEAMNTLRHLHQAAGSRFRSILKKKFETLDLHDVFLEGFIIVKLGEKAAIAKLGAYRCISIGKEVFEVPESAVKQLQPGVNF